MKKRLAYSTVSQVSYILFGLSLFDAAAMAGALSHVIFHCLAKTGLFLAAGAVIYETGEKRVEKFLGDGKTDARHHGLLRGGRADAGGHPAGQRVCEQMVSGGGSPLLAGGRVFLAGAGGALSQRAF